jgi:hypothetical protein
MRIVVRGDDDGVDPRITQSGIDVVGRDGRLPTGCVIGTQSVGESRSPQQIAVDAARDRYTWQPDQVPGMASAEVAAAEDRHVRRAHRPPFRHSHLGARYRAVRCEAIRDTKWDT